MKDQKNIIEIFQNEFDRLPDEDIVLDNFYIKYKEQYVHVASTLDPKYRDIIEGIKKIQKTKVQFAIAYQKTMLKMAMDLSSSSIKVLVYLMSQMKYRNAIFDFKYTDLVNMFGMSYSTITKSINELVDKKYIKVDGKRTNLVYHISPEVCWKGSVYSMQEKLKMFMDED